MIQAIPIIILTTEFLIYTVFYFSFYTYFRVYMLLKKLQTGHFAHPSWARWSSFMLKGKTTNNRCLIYDCFNSIFLKNVNMQHNEKYI